MTQPELINQIISFKCCSAKLADILINKLMLGNKCSLDSLTLLNDYIKLLSKYDLTSTNCITEEDFNNMIQNARNICGICDCK